MIEHIKFSLLFSLIVLINISCKGQVKSEDITRTTEMNNTTPEASTQIGDYVVSTFQDSKGNLWFGTLEKGVAIFDGTSLTYLTIANGLPSNRIVDIIEDTHGTIWFATGEGISKYDGKDFINFSEADGLVSNTVSVLYIDSKNRFWVGTWSGVSLFDGRSFTDFKIPNPVIDTTPNPDTQNWITDILEDSKGTIWFGRDGYGAARYDDISFQHLTIKEGLNSNNVQSMEEDADGTIWIGTRVAEKDHLDPEKRKGSGGLNKYDGKSVTHVSEIAAFNRDDVYEIYKDQKNNLWITTTNHGIYEYTNGHFKHHNVQKSCMSIVKDTKGNVWLGCSGGLFRLNEKGIVNITVDGPWDMWH